MFFAKFLTCFNPSLVLFFPTSLVHPPKKNYCIMFCQLFNSTFAETVNMGMSGSCFVKPVTLKFLLSLSSILLAYPLACLSPRITVVCFSLPLLILYSVNQTFSPSFEFKCFLFSPTPHYNLH